MAINVPSSATEFGRANFSSGEVLLFNTRHGPRTVLTVRQLLLWRALVTVRFPPSGAKSPISTVGWMDYGVGSTGITVLAVTVNSPLIAAIAAGPSKLRRIQAVHGGGPIILRWRRAIPFDNLQAVALTASGKGLYRYGYPKFSGVHALPAWYSTK